MKKTFFIFLSALFLTFGCYDDSAILELIKNHQSQIDELKSLYSKQNTNIESLQAIVNALQSRDYVSGIAPIKEGDVVLGYTIVFSQSGSVTLYNGKDGYVPSLGVRQDGDLWCWVIDGEWVTDADGNKINASAKDGETGAVGVTPVLKIEDGYWYISYDEGKTWEAEPLGQATGDAGDSMFGEVTYDDEYVYITMSDGQQLVLPRRQVYEGENIVGPATVTLDKLTATTATFGIHMDVPDAELPYCRVMVYYSNKAKFNFHDGVSCLSCNIYDRDTTLVLKNLTFNHEYEYCICVESKSGKAYSDIRKFTTKGLAAELVLDESSLTTSSAVIKCVVPGLSSEDSILIDGIRLRYYDDVDNVRICYNSNEDGAENDTLKFELSRLVPGRVYNCCLDVNHSAYGDVIQFATKALSAELVLDESSLTGTSVVINCIVPGISSEDSILIDGIQLRYYDDVGNVRICYNSNENVADSDTLIFRLYELTMGQKYSYCLCVNGEIYGEVYSFETSRQLGVFADAQVNYNWVTFTSSSTSYINEYCLEIYTSAIPSDGEPDPAALLDSMKLLPTDFPLTIKGVSEGTYYYRIQGRNDEDGFMPSKWLTGSFKTRNYWWRNTEGTFDYNLASGSYKETKFNQTEITNQLPSKATGTGTFTWDGVTYGPGCSYSNDKWAFNRCKQWDNTTYAKPFPLEAYEMIEVTQPGTLSFIPRAGSTAENKMPEVVLALLAERDGKTTFEYVYQEVLKTSETINKKDEANRLTIEVTEEHLYGITSPAKLYLFMNLNQVIVYPLKWTRK